MLYLSKLEKSSPFLVKAAELETLRLGSLKSIFCFIPSLCLSPSRCLAPVCPVRTGAPTTNPKCNLVYVRYLIFAFSVSVALGYTVLEFASRTRIHTHLAQVHAQTYTCLSLLQNPSIRGKAYVMRNGCYVHTCGHGTWHNACSIRTGDIYTVGIQ
jgi:hypothetical protein